VEASPEQRPGRTHRRLGQQPDQRRAGPLDRSAPRCRSWPSPVLAWFGSLCPKRRAKTASTSRPG